MAAKDEDDIDDDDDDDCDTFLNNIFHRDSDTEDSDVDDDDDDGEKKPENHEEEQQQQQEEKEEEEKQHYLQSIDAFVKVRVLHSLGLSFQLWPAASTLVNLLDQQPHNNNASPLSPIFFNNSGSDSSSSSVRRPLRILELGSGTGLVGICAAAILGSFVTLTDLPHVLPNLQFNAESNSSVVSLRGGNVNVASLRWGETEDFDSIGREFDIILGTDVVYHDHLFDPLLQTLKFFLNGGGGEADGGNEKKKKKNKMVFIMAHLRRWKKDSVFFKKARKMFNVETLHTDPPSHGSRTGVVVYKFSGKDDHPHPLPQVQSKSKSTIGNETVPPMDG